MVYVMALPGDLTKAEQVTVRIYEERRGTLVVGAVVGLPFLAIIVMLLIRYSTALSVPVVIGMVIAVITGWLELAYFRPHRRVARLEENGRVVIVKGAFALTFAILISGRLRDLTSSQREKCREQLFPILRELVALNALLDDKFVAGVKTTVGAEDYNYTFGKIMALIRKGEERLDECLA